MYVRAARLRPDMRDVAVVEKEWGEAAFINLVFSSLHL